MKALGIGNPEVGSTFMVTKLGNGLSPSRLAFHKGSGYGMVTLDKTNKVAVIELFRIGGGGSDILFNGFPITVYIGGRPNSTSNGQKVRRK